MKNHVHFRENISKHGKMIKNAETYLIEFQKYISHRSFETLIQYKNEIIPSIEEIIAEKKELSLFSTKNKKLKTLRSTLSKLLLQLEQLTKLDDEALKQKFEQDNIPKNIMTSSDATVEVNEPETLDVEPLVNTQMLYQPSEDNIEIENIMALSDAIIEVNEPETSDVVPLLNTQIEHVIDEMLYQPSESNIKIENIVTFLDITIDKVEELKKSDSIYWLNAKNKRVIEDLCTGLNGIKENKTINPEEIEDMVKNTFLKASQDVESDPLRDFLTFILNGFIRAINLVKNTFKSTYEESTVFFKSSTLLEKLNTMAVKETSTSPSIGV